MFDHMNRKGVGLSDGQRTEPGTAVRTVHAVVPAQEFAVVYDDEEGRRHRTILVQVGSDLYLHPHGEAWTAALRLLHPDTWLAKQVTPLLALRRPPEARAEVDVLGTKK